MIIQQKKLILLLCAEAHLRMETVVITEGSFEELLEQAVTGSIIDVSGCKKEDAGLAMSPILCHVPPGDCEFFRLDRDGDTINWVSLGKHEYDMFHQSCRGPIIRRGSEFLRINNDGSEWSFGHHQCSDWHVATGTPLLRQTDHSKMKDDLVLVREDGTEQSLGHFVFRDWAVWGVSSPYGFLFDRIMKRFLFVIKE